MAEIWLDESGPVPENNLLCCKCMWWGIIFGPLSGSELYSVRIWAGNFPLVNIPMSRDQQVCQYLSFPQLFWTQLCIKRSEGQWNCLSSLKKKSSPALRRLVVTGWAVCVRAEMCRVCSPGLPRWHGPFAGPTQPSPYMRWPGVSGLCSLVPAFPLLRIRYSFWGNILLTCGENSVKIPATEFQSEYYSSSMQGQKSS